jgi:hypothetical protein
MLLQIPLHFQSRFLAPAVISLGNFNYKLLEIMKYLIGESFSDYFLGN